MLLVLHRLPRIRRSSQRNWGMVWGSLRLTCPCRPSGRWWPNWAGATVCLTSVVRLYLPTDSGDLTAEFPPANTRHAMNPMCGEDSMRGLVSHEQPEHVSVSSQFACARPLFQPHILPFACRRHLQDDAYWPYANNRITKRPHYSSSRRDFL